MKINALSLPESIEKALSEMGYEDFTAIQEMTLPALLNHEAKVQIQNDLARNSKRSRPEDCASQGAGFLSRPSRS